MDTVFILIDFLESTPQDVKLEVGKYLRNINKPEFIRIIRYASREDFDREAALLLKSEGLDDVFACGSDFMVHYGDKIFYGRKLSNFVSQTQMSYWK